MPLSDSELEALETTHKRTAIVRGDFGEVVYRKPTRAEYKQFRAQINNPAQMSDAVEILARKCVVYPSREAYDALLEDWPAVPEASSKAFMALVGLSATEDSK